MRVEGPSQKLDEIQDLFRAILKCISVSLSFNSVSSSQRRKHRPVDNYSHSVYYRQLAKALIASGLFEGSQEVSARTIIDMIIGITPLNPTPLCLQANPGVVEVCLELLPYLSESVASYTLDMISAYLQSSMDARRRMSQVRLVPQILLRFSDILELKSHPLRAHVLFIISLCCGDYLTVPDLMSVFSEILCRNVTTDLGISGMQSLPPWKAADLCSSSLWTGLDLLLSLSSSENVDKSAPYVSFSHTTMMSFSSTSLSDISLNIWVNFHSFESGGRLEFLSIMNEELSEKLVSFTLDFTNSVLVVVLHKAGAGNTTRLRFPAGLILFTSWHLITINFKKNKLRSTLSIVVCIDASPCENVDADCTEDVEVKTSGKSTRRRTIVLGSSNFVSASDASHVKRPRQDKPAFELWRCGTIRVFPEPLSSKQLLHMLLNGPNYLGTFKELDPLQELSSVHATLSLLSLGHKYNANAEVIDEIGLSGIGLDLITDPTLEVSKHSLSLMVERVVFPSINLQYVANYSREMSVSENPSIFSGDATPSFPAFELLNSAGLAGSDRGKQSIAIAKVFHSPHVSPSCESLSSSIASLGGPSIIFPLLHSAGNETQLSATIELLTLCCRNNSCNLRFMQTKGFRVISFILSLKSSAILTCSVFERLLDLCKFSFTEGADKFYILHDPIAFYHLILNHQVCI